jgi:hypothetical protein
MKQDVVTATSYCLDVRSQNRCPGNVTSSLYFYNPPHLHITTTIKMSACYLTCCWGETTSLNCGHQLAFCSSPRWYEYGEPRWKDIDTGKPKNSEKPLSQCHFCTTNPTWTDPDANTGLVCEKPATNRLNHGTALSFNILGIDQLSFWLWLSPYQ